MSLYYSWMCSPMDPATVVLKLERHGALGARVINGAVFMEEADRLLRFATGRRRPDVLIMGDAHWMQLLATGLQDVVNERVEHSAERDKHQREPLGAVSQMLDARVALVPCVPP